MRTLKNQFIQKINLTKVCFFMLAILAMTFTSCEKDGLELERTTEETIEQSATAQKRIAQTEKETITLPETAEKTEEIKNLKIDEEDKSTRVLIYSRNSSVSQGAMREWYYNRLDFDDPLEYKFEVVITPLSGDPDLYLAGYNAGTKRTIRSSRNGAGVDSETMRITDLHSYETRAYIRVYGYSASNFRIDIYRTSVDCVEYPAADQVTILLWSPVCGCDGVEYANYQAATVSGITSYTNGPCSCTITEDDFEGMSIFSRIAAQSSNWRTWNSGYEGTLQDAIVHQTGWGGKMLKIKDENPSGAGYQDVVRKFGYNTTGAFDLSFDMWIPNGYKGYFNLQSSQTNLVGGGFWQIFFEGNGIARIIIGGTTYQSFYYTQGSWLDIDLRINLDTDQVTSRVNNGNTKTLNYNGNIHLGGINFYATDGALFYVDNIELSDAYCNGFAGNDEDSSLNKDNSEINMEALQNAADDKPALEFDSAKVAVPTADTTTPAPNTEK